jgi:hypothetical protein
MSSDGSSIEVIGICPLGMKGCEYVEDNKMYRCNWYMRMQGNDPQTGEAVDKWGCSIVWGPITAIETSKTNRRAGQAVESLRDHVVSGNNQFLGLISQAKALADGNNSDR